jgi:hypothetical protein
MTKKDETRYNLQESLEKIGHLPIPKLADKHGNIIDGLHRTEAGARVPTIRLPIDDELQFYIVRAVANLCRRRPSREEIVDTLSKIAELSEWTPREMAKNLPFSYTFIMKYLPDDFKKRPGAGPKVYPVTRRVTQQGRSEATIAPSETNEDFAERFTKTLKFHIKQITEKDFPAIVNYMDDEHNCEKCVMEEPCLLVLDLVKALQTQLPVCMKNRTR